MWLLCVTEYPLAPPFPIGWYHACTSLHVVCMCWDEGLGEACGVTMKGIMSPIRIHEGCGVLIKYLQQYVYTYIYIGCVLGWYQ